jgi:peptidyl-prolyl cis-trans isomerase B (cyclophilin B)
MAAPGAPVGIPQINGRTQRMTLVAPRRVSLAFAIALTLAVVALQGCSTTGGSAPDRMHDSVTQTDGAGNAATSTSTLKNPQEEPVFEPTIDLTGNEVAVITTAKGVIRLAFFGDVAPNHVKSFIELAKSGFYDGTTFHRIDPGFVAQGGDPNSKTGAGPVGNGGPGYRIKAEFSSKPHLEGTLAMARSNDPDSAGSQFYICLAPAPFLDGKYTVFGEVVEGMGVVKQLAVGDVMLSVVIENAQE